MNGKEKVSESLWIEFAIQFDAKLPHSALPTRAFGRPVGETLHPDSA